MRLVRSLRLARVFLVMLPVLYVIEQVAVRADEDALPLSERSFREEYAKAVHKMTQFPNNVAVQLRGVATANNTTTKRSLTLLEKGTARQVEECRESASHAVPSEYRVVSNSPTVAFELKKRAKDAPYIITNLLEARDAKSGGITTSLNLRVTPLLHAATSLFDMPISDLLRDRAIKVQDIRPIGSGGRLVQVQFSFPNPQYNYKKALITFDPSLDWAVSQYVVQFNSIPGVQKEERSGLFKYERQGPNGIVIPKHIEIEDHTIDENGKEYKHSTRYEVVAINFDEVTDAQFKLSAFGLPDISPGSSYVRYPFDQWYFWGFVAIAIIVGIAIKRRRTAISGNRH